MAHTKSKIEKLKAMVNGTDNKGEASAAKNLINKIQMSESKEIELASRVEEGITIDSKVVITRYKGAGYALVDSKRIKRFFDLVVPGTKQTYRSFIREDFGQGDFYVMIDLMNSIGAVEKQGSSYIFDKDCENKFKEYFNNMVEGLKL